MLAPALRPGDVVVMDCLAAHKVAGVKDAIRAAGASLLYLPSYSPDLNPIEQFFAKLKAMLRSAASRTKDALRGQDDGKGNRRRKRQGTGERRADRGAAHLQKTEQELSDGLKISRPLVASVPAADNPTRRSVARSGTAQQG